MTGRPPILENEEEAIHHYVGIYYQKLAENPEARETIEKHVSLVEVVNKRYLKALKRGKNFNYEAYADKFIDCIDFLTKVFSKNKAQIELNERIKKLRSKMGR